MPLLADAAKELGDWLSGLAEWDWFLTVTFREPLPKYREESVVHAVGEHIRHTPYGANRPLVLAAEPHRSGATHLHGLLDIDPMALLAHWRVPSPGLPSSRHEKRTAWTDHLWESLFRTYGRSKVEWTGHHEAVSRYVSKYVTKGLSWWQIW